MVSIMKAARHGRKKQSSRLLHVDLPLHSLGFQGLTGGEFKLGATFIGALVEMTNILFCLFY
jgi:hypothetical protein